MTKYHFLALSSKTVCQFLQLRFMRCYLLNKSMSLANSVSFICLPCSEFLGTSVSVLSGSWSRWTTSLSSATGVPRMTTRPGICTIRYLHSPGGLGRGILFPCSGLPGGNAVVLYSKAYGFSLHPLENVN